MKFKGAKLGKNATIKNFSATSEFCVGHKIHGQSVTDLIDQILRCCPWITIHKRNKRNSTQENGTTTQKKQKISLDEDEINVRFDRRPLDSIRFKENLIGKFEVNVLTLSEPPSNYMARKINMQWVDVIRSKLMREPTVLTTALPVLIDPCQVKEKKDFCVDKMSTYSLWTIGGNHVRTALHGISKESPLNEMRNVHIHLYCGLSEEEAIQLGNIHNGAQQSLKPTFQDCIEQAMRYRHDKTQLAKKVTQMMTDIEMREVPKESVGIILSVLKYSDDCLEILSSIFQKFEQQNGALKSIPQTLFRELQGVKDHDRTGFLQFALDHGLEAAVKKVKKSKKKGKLEACFQKIMNVTDLELCSQLYPEHMSQIDKFTELEIHKNTIPEIFLEFCNNAKAAAEDAERINFNPEIQISVLHKGKNISNLKCIQNLIKKAEKLIGKGVLENEFKIINELNTDHDEPEPEPVESNESESEIQSESSNETDNSFEINSDLSVLSVSVSGSDAETQPPQSQDLF